MSYLSSLIAHTRIHAWSYNLWGFIFFHMLNFWTEYQMDLLWKAKIWLLRSAAVYHSLWVQIYHKLENFGKLPLYFYHYFFTVLPEHVCLILKTFNVKKVHNLSRYDKDTQKWGKRDFLQVGFRRLPVVDRCSSVIYQTRLLRPPAWPTAAFGWTSEKGYLCISQCYHLIWQNKDLLKRPK